MKTPPLYPQLLALLCIWDTTDTHATMYETLPILWADTKTSLKSGDSEIKQAIKFQSPCHLFNDSSIVEGTQDFFIKWCESEVETAVIKSLEDMCRPDFAKSRKKRFLPRVVNYVRPLVSSIFGLGYWSWWYPHSAVYQLSNTVNQLSYEANLLKQRVEAGEKRTAELEAKVNALAEAVQALDDRIKTTEVEIDKINEWKTDLVQSLGSTMTLTAKLTAYFELCKLHMNEVKRDWKEGKLNLHLFDIFMMGSDEELIDKFKGAKPLGCDMNTREGVVTFRFKKEDTDFGVHVLKANPFTMYKLINGSNLGYKLEYVGPQQIAYDSMANCIVPFSGTATEVVLFPGQKDCLPMNDLSVYKYWRKTCEPMYYLDETAIQFKTLGDSYYIYCFGFKIRIYKSTYDCPNYVFNIHVNETIEILNGKAVAKMLKPDDLEPSTDFHSKKIVYHLMPQVMKLNIDTFNLSNYCPTSASSMKQMERLTTLETSAGGNSAAYIILGVFFVVFVGFGGGIIYYVKKKTDELKRIQYEQRQNTLPLLSVDSSNQKQYEIVK